jgi:excisionase family DNA binding protein
MHPPFAAARNLHDRSPPDPTPLLISVQDLATILKISTRSVWRLLSAGKLPSPVRIGGAVRWRYDEVKHWIDAGCPESPHSHT